MMQKALTVLGRRSVDFFFALVRAYLQGCSQIQWADAYYRKDIGWKDVARLKGARAFGRQAEQPETDDL
eukprot:441022-Pelagomonas_calceolata.AAC.1